MQQFASFSRRNLLKTGMVGTLAVAAGSLGLALRDGATRYSTPALKTLHPREYAVLAAISARLAPALGQGAPGASALDVAEKIDKLLAQTDAESQKGVKIALLLFENALTGALLGERISPFTKLAPDQQDRVLAAWRDSHIGFRRTVFAALSRLTLAAYWGNERTWPRLGYAGPPQAASLRASYAENLIDLDPLRAVSAAEER